MKKIANTQELQSELRSLLSYASSPNPSREKIASALLGLSNRVAMSSSLDRSTWGKYRKKLDSALDNAQVLFIGLTDFKEDLESGLASPVEALHVLEKAKSTTKRVDDSYTAFRDTVDGLLAEYSALIEK